MRYFRFIFRPLKELVVDIPFAQPPVGGGFFHGFFPWYFIGRTFGVGPMAGVRTAPTPQTQQNTAPAGSANTKPAGNVANGTTVQQGTAGSTQNSKLGSTGSTGKSGIGSGMSRSSGSAIS